MLQIVRGDINELNTMDLGGAPYAYTPFCDSRKDMDGFRFWKQGYWRNHLQGRKYHISALYVVDLKRFRKIAAGDRLRGQYQVGVAILTFSCLRFNPIEPFVHCSLSFFPVFIHRH